MLTEMLKTKWHFEIDLINSFECKSKTVDIESLRIFLEFLTSMCGFYFLCSMLVKHIVWYMAFLFRCLLYVYANTISCACCSCVRCKRSWHACRRRLKASGRQCNPTVTSRRMTSSAAVASITTMLRRGTVEVKGNFLEMIWLKCLGLCFEHYWAIQQSWFARVNALCNLLRKKSREVAAHFQANF